MRLLSALILAVGLLAGCGSKDVRRRGSATGGLTNPVCVAGASALAQAGEKHAFDKVRQLSGDLARAQAALDQYMSEWEKLAA